MNNLPNPAPSLDTWTVIFLLAAAQGIFLTITLLLNKKGAKLSNLLLASFIALFSLTLLEYVLHWTRYIYYFPQVNTYYLCFVFLFGPLLLLYYQSIENGGKLPLKAYLHLVPALLFFINRIPFYFSSFASKQAIITGNIEGMKNLQRPFIPIHQYHDFLINGHLVLYCLLIIVYLKRKDLWRKPITDSDTIQIIKHRWFRTLLWLFVGFTLANLSYYVLVKFPFFKIEWDYGISFAMTLFIYTVGFLGYHQTEIFQGKLMQKLFLPPKYQTSSLTPSASQSLLEKLLSYFETQKPYLDNDLRLSSLADTLGISTHHLSQVINEQLGKSFSDFINEYRIKEAQNMLADPGHENTYIINIAYDCGFNNKTSFNKAFKQFTGMAPSSYRKQALKTAKLPRKSESV
jgi:AraC-like DNA-binding protein